MSSPDPLAERLAQMSQNKSSGSQPSNSPKRSGGGGGSSKVNNSAKDLSKDNNSVFLALKILFYSLLSPKKVILSLWVAYKWYAVFVLSIGVFLLAGDHIFRYEQIVKEEVPWELKPFDVTFEGIRYLGEETMDFLGTSTSVVRPSNQVDYLQPTPENSNTRIERATLSTEERALLEVLNGE